ncbi:MAG: alpha/beta hydrolase [Phreatobacter sp.]|uniref:alpha/beta fold hydrolase n=1 Tax=Phreatobacter sp. TaxID=1966341 RepID=UPI002733B023|nr:alpha/beta hydrolase [Phreatobacter sp.]MDP2800530.1 alpha/beta hydrolase [Phreatobacter sp.]
MPIGGALIRAVTACGLALSALCAPAAAQEVKSYRTTIALPNRSSVALHVEDWGVGRPIVLLHGLGASSYMWRHLAPVLAKQYRVIAVDLKGFGRSDKPADGGYRIEDHAASIIALLRRLKLDDVTLVGHSLGGAIALLLAVEAERAGDRRISRLILMNSPAFEQPPSWAISVLRLPLVPYVLLPALTPEFGARAILNTGNGNSIPQPDIDAYARPLRDPGALHALIETGRGIVPVDFQGLIARYSRLTQPTLVIWCRDDPTVPLAIGQRLSRTLPRAELRIFNSCRHVPPEQSIDETERVVRAFLRRSD